MSTTLTSRLLVRLVDGVSAPANKAAVGLRRLIGASDRAATASAGTMVAAQRDIGIVSRGVVRATSSLAMPLGLLGTLGARTVYEYAKAGNAMQAVTGATDEQRGEIEKLALELNEKFPNKLSDIMSAAFELGRAGLDFEQIIGGLEGTLQLGLAGDIAVDQAADIATNVLTAMGLASDSAEATAASLQKVNDVLAHVATSSRSDVPLMGQTLKYVAPIAAAAGLELEQLGAASLVMAKSGIFGAEAGVAMRSALVRMVRPTKPMIAALERLGVSLDDFVTGGREVAGSDIVGSLAASGIDASAFEKRIDDILADPDLRKSTAAMTAAIAEMVSEGGTAVDAAAVSEAVSDALTMAGSEVDFFGFMEALKAKGADLGDIARIFDARQGSRLITLLAGDLDKALKEIEEGSKGSAKEMAEKRMDGIVGDVNRLVAALDKLWISIGEAGVLATVGDAFGRIAAGLDRVASASPTLLRLGTYAGMAVVALMPLGMAFTGLAGVAGLLVGGLGLLLSPIGLVVAGLALLGGAVWYFWDDIKKIGSFFGGYLSRFGSWVAGHLSDAASAVGNGIVAFAEGAADMIRGFRDGLVEGGASVIEWVAEFAPRVGAAIAGAGVSLFDAGAELLRSLWEGMKSMFGSIVRWAGTVPSQLGAAIKGAFGFGGDSSGSSPPGRARGGPVTRGRSYIVGEHRPEIFTPGASGYISPRAEGGGGSAVPTPVMNFTFNVNGVTDARALVDDVVREVNRRANEMLRGVHADARSSFAY